MCVPKAVSPRVNQCHLAFLSETSLPQGGPAWGIEGLGEPLRVPASPALRTLGTAAPGAVGLLRAQSRCCPACASSALSSAVWMCTRGTWHLSEWIFLKKCASVYAVHDISPHPCCHCHSAFSQEASFPIFLMGKFFPSPLASCI